MRNEYHTLKPTLDSVLSKRDTLEKKVSTFDKDQMALRNAVGLLKDLKSRTKEIKEKQDELLAKYKSATKDKNDMSDKYESAIAQLRNKANFKNDVLE
jgi:predicted transcriptional regulator